MLGVLVFDTLPGLFIGIGISLLLLLHRASRPQISELGEAPDGQRFDDLDRDPDSHRVPGVVVLRVESGLFFANADAVRTRARRAASEEGVNAVVLDAETVPFIDVGAARMVDALQRDGVCLLLARDVGQVRDVLGKVDSAGTLDTLYPTVHAAVAAARSEAVTGPP